MSRTPRSTADRIVSFGLYPLLLAGAVSYAWLELAQPRESLGQLYGYFLGALVLTLVVVEALHPMRDDWKMTRSNFLRRDLPYTAIGAATLGIASYVAGWLIPQVGLARGDSHAGLALLPSVVLALIVPDFIWYWLHRLSHEGRGAIGGWLWRVHVPHHLPQQLHVTMHVVAHPLGAVAVRVILTAPLFLLGLSTEAIFVANVIVGLQGLVSHFNVDLRAGWLNYVLVGNELHRYHHSAAIAEAKNYGAAVPLWDLVFGTFVYRPGVAPLRLGVADPSRYPAERDVLGILALPFVGDRPIPRGAPHETRPGCFARAMLVAIPSMAAEVDHSASAEEGEGH